MTFRVEWAQTALDQLATEWVQGDAARRQAMTAAVHAIDQRLANNPTEEGESRPNEVRITFEAPVSVRFRIDPEGSNVTVLEVHLFFTGKR